MAKKNTLAGLAVAGGILAVGSLFNRKKRKDAQKAAEEANRKAEEELEVIMSENPLNEGVERVSEPQGERKCPNCGAIDSNGSSTCPVCFSSMDGSSDDEYVPI